MNDILQQIIAVKHEEVALARNQKPLELVRADAESRLLTRPFLAAIEARLDAKKPAVIAEIKKASPSKGIIRENFSPSDIAQSYTENDAACLSVLTDKRFFQGCTDYLKQARASCPLPVLRKDFIIDEYQIYESRSIGADCILLIAACLDDARLLAYETIAFSLGMAVLVEVHNGKELESALRLATPLIGINNRNLHNFEVDLNTSIRLKNLLPKGRIVVAESGISTSADVKLLRDAGINTFLIGDILMRSEDPGEKLTNLFA